MITPIEQARGIAPMTGSRTETAAPTQDAGMFGAIFQNAIDNVRTTDAAKTEAQYLLATGQLDNPASAMIAATKSSIAVDMLVQARNKALESYTELTRISM